VILTRIPRDQEYHTTGGDDGEIISRYRFSEGWVSESSTVLSCTSGDGRRVLLVDVKKTFP
jgi:hypothetical protein